jgi:GAF domain-containing protein
LKPLDTIQFKSKKQLYDFMAVRMNTYVTEDPDWCSNLSNASALLWSLIDEINWAGFYLMKDGQLILGPFQGKPACVRIELGKGVCGTAAMTGMTQLVRDVHEFPGHIACDSASNSELVVPILSEGNIVGVIDIDSPKFDRFDKEDAHGLERIAEILARHIDWKRVLLR